MVEVENTSDRLISIKLEVDRILINIVSAYVPQVGCDKEKKEAFWADLEEVVGKILRGETCDRGGPNYSCGGRKHQ